MLPLPDVAEQQAESRRTRHGSERKQQLLDVAARLFAERGYENTRVIDICREAGVAKGLFYWYFSDKEQLFKELVAAKSWELRLAQAEAIDAAANPLVRIRQGVEASVRFTSQQRRLFSMWEVDNLDEAFAPIVRASTRMHAEDASRHIAEGIAQGLIRDEDPLVLAYLVVGTLASLSVVRRSSQLDLSVDDIAAAAGRYVVHALAVDAETAASALQM